MKNQYPIINSREVLNPCVIIMSEGKDSPLDAIVLTQREYNYLRKFSRNGGNINVKPI
mgnify:CR=1 FL=1